MIEIQQLTKRFRGGTVLEGVDLSVPEGHVCGLVGTNGAGKTTLLRVLATLIVPTRGTVCVAGHSLPGAAAAARRVIGYMPDRLAAYEELRVGAFLELFAHLYELPHAIIPETVVDILELVDLLPLQFSQIEHLSLGVRQRLSLARALLHNPQVLLLDEPISGLDPRGRLEMRGLLRELGAMGKTVLVSSHILGDLADLCDQLVIVEAGRVVFSGTLDMLRCRVQVGRWLRVKVENAARLPALRDWLRFQPWVREFLEVPGDARDGLRVAIDEALPLAGVAAALWAAGHPIVHFAEEPLDLEAAFLCLTQGLVQ